MTNFVLLCRRAWDVTHSTTAVIGWRSTPVWESTQRLIGVEIYIYLCSPYLCLSVCMYPCVTCMCCAGVGARYHELEGAAHSNDGNDKQNKQLFIMRQNWCSWRVSQFAVVKMSLFKARTWWSTQCPDYEQNYDACLLHCCRFGLENGEKDCIVVGSHAGYLNIFQPIHTEDSVNTENAFKPTDLVLEVKLPSPILQITSGTFLMYSYNYIQYYWYFNAKIICVLLLSLQWIRSGGQASTGRFASNEIVHILTTDNRWKFWTRWES